MWGIGNRARRFGAGLPGMNTAEAAVPNDRDTQDKGRHECVDLTNMRTGEAAVPNDRDGIPGTRADRIAAIYPAGAPEKQRSRKSRCQLAKEERKWKERRQFSGRKWF